MWISARLSCAQMALNKVFEEKVEWISDILSEFTSRGYNDESGGVKGKRTWLMCQLAYAPLSDVFLVDDVNANGRANNPNDLVSVVILNQTERSRRKRGIELPRIQTAARTKRPLLLLLHFCCSGMVGKKNQSNVRVKVIKGIHEYINMHLRNGRFHFRQMATLNWDIPAVAVTDRLDQIRSRSERKWEKCQIRIRNINETSHREAGASPMDPKGHGRRSRRKT